MREMNEATVAPISSSSFSSCSPNEIAIGSGDCLEDGMPLWLEDEALAGFRVWQLAGIVLSVLLSILIGLCCCVRFRVPRTKQEIEADYIRKRITESFRYELSKISDTEMDEMDLKKALSKIQNKFHTESYKTEKEGEEGGARREGVRSRLNAMLGGIRFARQQHADTDNII